MKNLIKEKREAEFRRRILSAIENKSKPTHWLWGLLNSRLFSVLVLGTMAAAAGTYFTQHQQCLADANRLTETWARLTRELHTRQGPWVLTVMGAKTVDDLRSAKLPYVYSEYKDASLYEIVRSRRVIARRIDFSPTREWEKKRLVHRKLQKFRAKDVIDYGGISVGLVPPTLTDSDLPEAQMLASKMFEIDVPQLDYELGLWVHPACSPTTIAKILLGKHPPIMVSSRGPEEGMILR